MDQKANALDWLSFVFLIIGGLNWGLIGFFDFNVVGAIFNVFPYLAKIVYILVGLSALYMIVSYKKICSFAPVKNIGKIPPAPLKEEPKEEI